MYNNYLEFEIKRKIFHFSAIIFPLIYYYIPKFYMIILLFSLTSLILYFDIMRRYSSIIALLIEKYFSVLMRKQEKTNAPKLTGASFMFVGFLVTLVCFPKNLVITSWCILIICDIASAILGMRYGKKIFYGKSLVGAISFFIFSILVSFLCFLWLDYHLEWQIIIITCLLTTLAEFFSVVIKIDDNFLIPLVYCIVASYI